MLVLVCAVGCAGVLAAAAPSEAHGAAVTYSGRLVGAEIWAQNQVGTFVGTSRGSLTGAWQATVEHTPLVRYAAVTGGSFETKAWLADDLRRIRGEFDGGFVRLLNPDSLVACVDQRYRVVLESPTLEVDATLIHHRRPFFSRCLIYSATVRGTLTATFDSAALPQGARGSVAEFAQPALSRARSGAGWLDRSARRVVDRVTALLG